MNYKIIDLKPIVTEKALSAQQTQDKYAFGLVLAPPRPKLKLLLNRFLISPFVYQYCHSQR